MKKIYSLGLIILLFIFSFANILIAIKNPVYMNSCYDGDDIIDDDLCINLNGNEVNMYPANKERSYMEFVFFMFIEMGIIVLTAFTYVIVEEFV